MTREKAVPIASAVKKARSKPKGAFTAAVGRASESSEYDTAKVQLAGVRFTHPDKVLYPEDGITKLELASYYRSIADWILPHIADRPLVLVRCPGGQGSACFYQKHPGARRALNRCGRFPSEKRRRRKNTSSWTTLPA